MPCSTRTPPKRPVRGVRLDLGQQQERGADGQQAERHDPADAGLVGEAAGDRHAQHGAEALRGEQQADVHRGLEPDAAEVDRHQQHAAEHRDDHEHERHGGRREHPVAEQPQVDQRPAGCAARAGRRSPGRARRGSSARARPPGRSRRRSAGRSRPSRAPSARDRRSGPRGSARAGRGPASRGGGRRPARRAGAPAPARNSAKRPIGRLMKKIQRHEKSSTSQPPRIGPNTGPSSIGTPMTAITRPSRCGPAARVMIVMPSGMIRPPPKPCRIRKKISEPSLHAMPESSEPDDEHADRGHVEALGAEPVGAPGAERDDGGEREGVAGRDPLDRRQRGVELGDQRRDRDVDDGHVEDRHDGAEHDDRGDEQELAVEPFVSRRPWRAREACPGSGTAPVMSRVMSRELRAGLREWSTSRPLRRRGS